MQSRQRHLPFGAGSGKERRQRHRLFIAVFPDPEAASGIAKLARDLRARHGLKGRPVASERLHVSLHHVGDYEDPPKDVAAKAHEAASSVAMPPFTVAFNSVVSFRGGPGNRPLVLLGGDGVAGLVALQRNLGAAMTKAGFGRGTPQYLPHMTLLYGDPLAAEQAVEPVSWTVREFILVDSLVGEGRYIPLARIGLHG